MKNRKKTKLIIEAKLSKIKEFLRTNKITDEDLATKIFDARRGRFIPPFNDDAFRWMFYNTLAAGENHTIDDIIQSYEEVNRVILAPLRASPDGQLPVQEVPGMEPVDLNPKIDSKSRVSFTYDEAQVYIDARERAAKSGSKTSQFQKILDDGFSGNKEEFEVIYEDKSIIVVYPKTYMGSIATARMGPDKKYYTPPSVIGIMSWCTSVVSSGNMFMNYHRRLNLHMYYITKKEGYSENDPYRKACVSVAKKYGRIEIHDKGGATVNGNNTSIAKDNINQAYGNSILKKILEDASQSSRLEIDPIEYYKSITPEQYKNLRSAAQEQGETAISLFLRETRDIIANTENEETVCEAIRFIPGMSIAGGEVSRDYAEIVELASERLSYTIKFQSLNPSTKTITFYVSQICDAIDASSYNTSDMDGGGAAPSLIASLFSFVSTSEKYFKDSKAAIELCDSEKMNDIFYVFEEGLNDVGPGLVRLAGMTKKIGDILKVNAESYLTGKPDQIVPISKYLEVIGNRHPDTQFPIPEMFKGKPDEDIFNFILGCMSLTLGKGYTGGLDTKMILLRIWFENYDKSLTRGRVLFDELVNNSMPTGYRVSTAPFHYLVAENVLGTVRQGATFRYDAPINALNPNLDSNAIKRFFIEMLEVMTVNKEEIQEVGYFDKNNRFNQLKNTIFKGSGQRELFDAAINVIEKGHIELGIFSLPYDIMSINGGIERVLTAIFGVDLNYEEGKSQKREEEIKKSKIKTIPKVTNASYKAIINLLKGLGEIEVTRNDERDAVASDYSKSLLSKIEEEFKLFDSNNPNKRKNWKDYFMEDRKDISGSDVDLFNFIDDDDQEGMF